MPGSIEFGCPRPDDPSLELQHDLVRFFVDCDSQHAMVCGNRGAKVRADTAEQVIYNEISGLPSAKVLLVSYFGKVTKWPRRLIVS